MTCTEATWINVCRTTQRMTKGPLLWALPAAACVLVTCAIPAMAFDETWFTQMKEQDLEIEPGNVTLLSLQVSKLPRDTFGNGRTSTGRTVSSWVVGSGTGLYGTFNLEQTGKLVFQKDASSLLRFTDDRGRDLTTNPGKEKPNTFFKPNKPVQVDVIPNKKTYVFTLRGFSPPARGASRVTAEARLKFLHFAGEQTAQKRNVKFASGTQVTLGPVRLKIHTPADVPARARRRTRGEGTSNKAKWAIVVQPRAKPVASIELLDTDGKVLKRSVLPVFEGRDYTWYVNETKTDPVTVRVNWYEKWGRISVPIKVTTSLGI